ncbi:32238_t:CDS:2, partial [Gigaspora margarita]
NMSEPTVNSLIELENAIINHQFCFFDSNVFTNFEKIDEGGFGEVYTVWWEYWKCTVALKSPKTNNIRKFIQELKIFKKHSIHPNIINFYGITKNSLIFTTNLVNGTNSFVEPQSLQVLPQIAERTSDNCYCKMNPINQINPDQYSLFTGYTQYYA